MIPSTATTRLPAAIRTALYTRSTVPIADRPSLLLKGSGRVKRILGPDEDLTDAMAEERETSKKAEGHQGSRLRSHEENKKYNFAQMMS